MVTDPDRKCLQCTSGHKGFDEYFSLFVLITFWGLHFETEKRDTSLLILPTSPEMPENEATFAITTGGIGDAKE